MTNKQATKAAEVSIENLEKIKTKAQAAIADAERNISRIENIRKNMDVRFKIQLAQWFIDAIKKSETTIENLVREIANDTKTEISEDLLAWIRLQDSNKVIVK